MDSYTVRLQHTADFGMKANKIAYMLSLPMFPELAAADVARVIAAAEKRVT